MTPAARIQTAIELLDAILGGAAAEQTLTNWARRSRFAGSGDRAAVRDHVFDALRCRRSFAWLGGSDTGRGLMLGACRATGQDPAAVFTGATYAPAALGDGDPAGRDLRDAPPGVRLDMPDWLLPDLEPSLGSHLAEVCAALRTRAPLFLRCNVRKVSAATAADALRAEAIDTRPHPLSPTALEVTANARRVKGSGPYAQGWVEFQDVASQAVVDALPLADGMRVLDFCAGGGGKSLAMAVRADLQIVAHDVDASRMHDIAPRAERAGVHIATASPADLPGLGPFDLVLCDAPCSGSGAWRRAPEAKWTLTPDRLRELRQLQGQILDQAATLVRPGGVLAYATCELLTGENQTQVAGFLARAAGWRLTGQLRFTPLDGGDGFFLALLAAP